MEHDKTVQVTPPPKVDLSCPSVWQQAPVRINKSVTPAKSLEDTQIYTQTDR